MKLRGWTSRSAICSLTSHRLRLERAEQHLDALGREIRVWVDVHRPLPKTAFDAQTGIHLVSFELPTSVPNDVFGPLIGDALHNLRSALDHLAYELAVAYTGDLSEETVEHSAFPIFVREPRTDDLWDKRIGGIAPEAQGVIKSVAALPTACVSGARTRGPLSALQHRQAPTSRPHRILDRRSMTYGPSRRPRS